MSIGTFGSFTQARLAIYASQTGLTVTGNNISNINTPGYTRQRLDQSSLYTVGSDRYYAEGDVRVGQGVIVNSLSQIRSPYLDIRFRKESASVGHMDAMLEGLNSIASILDEVGKGDESKDEGGFGVLGLEIKKLFTALQDLTDQTGHQEYDNSVRASADALVKKFNSYASQLEQVRQNTLTDFHQDIEKVNGILNNIRELNEEIRKCDIHGDNALELRDERNLQIDELSKLVKIDVTYSMEEFSYGVEIEKLTIRLGNANPNGAIETDSSLLIDGIYGAQLILEQVPEENPAYNKDLNPGDPGYVGKYLKPNGEDTDDPAEARQIDNSNLNMTVSELRSKIGRLLYTNSKGPEELIDKTDAAAMKDALEALAKGGVITENDKPTANDITLTKYKQVHRRNPNGTFAYEADGKTPIYDYYKQVVVQTASKPVELDDNDLYGELQAERELLTEQGQFSDLSVIAEKDMTGPYRTGDESASGKRGIPYFQKTLDLLANQLANAFNAANQGFRVDDKGNYITEGTNAAGKPAGVPVTITAGGVTHTLNKNDTWDKLDPAIQQELQNQTGLTYQAKPDNLKEIVDAYLKGPDYDPADPTSEKWKETARGIFDGGVLFSNHPAGNDPSGITAANISISQIWKDADALIVRSFECPPGELEPASGQSSNILHLRGLFSEKMDYIPNVLPGTEGASNGIMFTGTFYEMWNRIGSTLGDDQSLTGTMLDTAYENALQIDQNRDSVSSVDFNDEAMNLMMYSKSYNAACRLMTTIDSVLDKLINNTGLTT